MKFSRSLIPKNLEPNRRIKSFQNCLIEVFISFQNLRFIGFFERMSSFIIEKKKNLEEEHQLLLEPNQVYSWDIIYLRTRIRGQFYYLYLMMDIWSRKLVGYRVKDFENMFYSAELFEEVFESENLEPNQVTLHADNGGPIKVR